MGNYDKSHNGIFQSKDYVWNYNDKGEYVDTETTFRTRLGKIVDFGRKILGVAGRDEI
jgi:hypothetical protein